MAHDDGESSGRSTAIKIGLGVVLLAAAGLIALSQRSTTVEQPDTPDTATLYVCVECGHGEALTPAAYVQRCEGGGVQEGQGKLRGAALLKCSKCNGFGMVKGTTCPKDGSPVPRINKNGEAGSCPKCKWSSSG